MFILFYIDNVHQYNAVKKAVSAYISMCEEHVLELSKKRATPYITKIINEHLRDIKEMQDFLIMLEQRYKV